MRRWLTWIGVAISIVLLFLALRGIRFDEFALAMQRANPLWLLPGIAFYLLTVIARAWRWAYLLRPLKALSVGQVFPIVVIGYMGNNIYPARIGELLRATCCGATRACPSPSAWPRC